MSKNIKDLINKAEEDEHTRALMEKTIENLKMEVDSLKTKLEAQKEPFKPPSVAGEEKKEDTEEIKILKEMVTSLREELNQKDQEKKKLNNKVKTLTNELDQMKEKESDTIKEEILLKTQNSLNTLIEDYNRLETHNKMLKQKIAALEQEKGVSMEQSGEETSRLDKSEDLKQEIDTLKDQISSLEQKNQSLLQDIKLLETKSSSSEELDHLIGKLKQNNTQLEQENSELSLKLEELKREKLKTLKYERKISDLTNKITELEETNKLLKKRDSILLAKTITAMESLPHKTKKKLEAQLPQVQSLSSKPVQEPKKKAEKINEVIKKPLEKPPSLKEKELEALEDEDVAETGKSIEASDEETTRKWQCPHCGNSNKAQIRELDDKERPIWGNFYAKKYICGQCGKEWR
ncbi:MAG: hypothetical protein EU539_09010 [Promethearchaeota archaeon]|nr:MAG: hypothetical protein EU539_09010 [Candidatus Lokiarchaeota archaeon]